MRLMNFLILPLCVSLTTGCQWFQPRVVSDDKANFCDVEEPRRFTQAELDWRAEHAPANLRRDFKTNTTWDRECVSAVTAAVER